VARQSKLTPEQWDLARRRWEGEPKDGFAWLSREIEAAWGVSVLRKSLEQWARAKGWEKGGEGLKELPPMVPAKAGKIPAKAERNIPARKRNVPAGAESPEVAEEVVESAEEPPAAPRPPGRPTLYRPEFAEKIIAFFDVEPFEDIPVPQPTGMVKLQRMPRKPPMLGAFAKSIGVSKTAVDAWATAINSDGSPRHPEFAEAYARARVAQEELLTVGGTMGAYEGRFLGMVMKNLCGWQDQPAPKVDHAAVSKDELERRFGQRMEAARVRQMAVLEERRQLRRLADEAANGVFEALPAPPSDEPELPPEHEPGAGGAPEAEP
jgi:hypothetical protein